MNLCFTSHTQPGEQRLHKPLIPIVGLLDLHQRFTTTPDWLEQLRSQRELAIRTNIKERSLKTPKTKLAGTTKSSSPSTRKSSLVKQLAASTTLRDRFASLSPEMQNLIRGTT